jgi:hypothetical protein
MRALAQDTRRFADACQIHPGRLVRGLGVEFDDLDPIVNELDRALVAMRTLDLEIFEKSDRAEYLALRSVFDEGQVVFALTAIRNAATHSAEVIDPNIDRAIGPSPQSTFLLFPRWKKREDLPLDTFQRQDGTPEARRARAYDAYVDGHLVLDTLLDAFKFFDQCDPTLMPRVDGQLPGFPLPPLEAPVGYYRLHPDWPSHPEVEERVRADAQLHVPSGTHRRIDGSILDGSVLCGYTRLDNGGGHIFTEAVSQVQRDVECGYRYTVPMSTKEQLIVLHDGALWCEDRTLTELLPDASTDIEHPWLNWWKSASIDAFFYREQRQPR